MRKQMHYEGTETGPSRSSRGGEFGVLPPRKTVPETDKKWIFVCAGHVKRASFRC